MRRNDASRQLTRSGRQQDGELPKKTWKRGVKPIYYSSACLVYHCANPAVHEPNVQSISTLVGVCEQEDSGAQDLTHAKIRIVDREITTMAGCGHTGAGCALCMGANQMSDDTWGRHYVQCGE